MNQLMTGLYAKLTGGTALTALLSGTTAVYDSLAPQSAALPYVIFQQQAWNVETADPRRREDAYMLVKAVSATGFAQAGSIDAACDALLDGGSISVTGHTVMWQKRIEQIRYIETDQAGRNIYHQGGLYQIRLRH